MNLIEREEEKKREIYISSKILSLYKIKKIDLE